MVVLDTINDSNNLQATAARAIALYLFSYCFQINHQLYFYYFIIIIMLLLLNKPSFIIGAIVVTIMAPGKQK